MDNIIELEHVDAGYPDAVILKDVSFSVARGEVFVLLGGSGCGKTTIMRHLTGLNPILAGRLTVAGLEWGPKTRDTLFRKIGVMYQSGALFGSMTCLDNVLLPLEEFARMRASERRERAMACLEAVEMADAARKMPSEISGGMRKRAAIARALALDPEVLFLDEPSAGLDPITSCALDDLILRLKDETKKTFVVVTHELPSIFKIADRAAMFDKARQGMIALGSPQELKERSDDPFVRKFFNRGEVYG